MRLAFAGTPPFAATALQALLAAGHEVVLVMTQPDRRAGRGMKLQESAVKALAQRHGLPLAQPSGLKTDGRFQAEARVAQEALHVARPDVVVVAAYGLILPVWLLDLPHWGCLNIHASLLPRWRGAAPIQRAIEAGDLETGITIMQMDAGLDTGPCLLMRRMSIEQGDSGASLHDRLAAMGGALIVEALQRIPRGELPPTPQPTEGVTYARKIEKHEAALDWRDSAATLERRVRAFDPFPGATLTHESQPVKVWRAAVDESGRGEPGEVLSTLPGPLRVACGDGALELIELQRPGARRVPALRAFPGGAPQPGQRLSLPAD
jgi:methionyl-tRNA formyltransferase